MYAILATLDKQRGRGTARAAYHAQYLLNACAPSLRAAQARVTLRSRGSRLCAWFA